MNRGVIERVLDRVEKNAESFEQALKGLIKYIREDISYMCAENERKNLEKEEELEPGSICGKAFKLMFILKMT